MKSRHRSREIALQILYQNDLTNIAPPKLAAVQGAIIKRSPIRPVTLLPSGEDTSSSPLHAGPTSSGSTLSGPVGLVGQAAQDTIAILQRHFKHFNVAEDLREFIAQLVTGTLAHRDEIDALLEKKAAHWKVSRMSSVDRSILRLASYELLFLKETPVSVVIDEAIELAKQFGTAETAPFINGILDSLKK